MTKNERLPYGFWKEHGEELKRQAQTKTNSELAKHFNITKKQITNAITLFQIKRPALRKCWKSCVEEMKALAPTMNAKAMAAHFSTSVDNMYSRLGQYGIVARSSRQPTKFAGGLEGLAEAAPTMTEDQLCAKFAITRRTVRKHLKRLAVSCKAPEHGSRIWGEDRKAQIEHMRNAGKTIEQIAEHFCTTPMYMRKRLQMYGVSTRQAMPAVPRPRQPATAAPKVRKPKLPGRIAGSAVYVPRPKPKPAQIIVPADVKITIVEFCPPPGTRICNGSSTQHYSPAQHGGAMRSYR